jgi:hypothetical protein
LARFAAGIDRLEGIQIVGNPLLELGDRVSIQFSRFGINEEYWIEGIADNMIPNGGYTQTLTLSVADAGQWFILDSSQTDGTDTLSF